MEISNVCKPNFKRNPFYAVLLSLAATGLGQIYCGNFKKGVILFCLGFVFIPITLSFYLPIDPCTLYPAVICSLIFSALVFLYAAADAWWLSKKTSGEYTLKKFNKWYIYLIMIAISLAYPLLYANFVKSNIVHAYKIPSSSMIPAILPGDYLFANISIYTRMAPERGDIVVFINPNQRHITFIKRIIGLPGDSIEIKNNIVIINNSPLSYTPAFPENGTRTDRTTLLEHNLGKAYKIGLTHDSEASSDFPKIIIPNGHCFVLGDNRDTSKDSRHFGPVPLRDIIGRAEFIYKPAGSWKRFGEIRE